MICPVCQWQNFVGDDLCDNCGADLRASDTPEPATGFRGPLLGLHLDELGAPAPETVDGSEDVARVVERMHARGDRLPPRHRGRAPGRDLHGS